MKKELEYIDIEYTENDLEYIDEICNKIDKKTDEIVKFFELKEFNEKTNVKLFGSLDEFRNFYKETYHREPKDWVCGFAKDNNVYTLSLSEYRKCLSHENSSIEDLERLMLHEFTHSVHLKRHNNITVKWISEGAATYLSGQHKDKKEITCTYEELINNAPYHNYKVMFEYVFNTYGKDYILKLIDDEELLRKETKRLFEEAKNICYNIAKGDEIMNKNILDFYLKAIELKNVDRTGWKEVGIDNAESVMDHIGGTVILAMAINSEKQLNLDMNKVYEMIAIKELKKVVSNREDSIISGSANNDTSAELLNILSNNSSLIEVYNEYNNGETKEAKFASMISKLESDIQAKKYELDGKFTIDNAKKDIENYPEELKSQLTDIKNASDGWLEYDKQYYNDEFKELSDDIRKLD